MAIATALFISEEKMKRIVTLLLVIIMVFSICSCGKTESTENIQFSISIDCSKISENMDAIENEAIRDLVPEDGIIFAEAAIGTGNEGSIMDATIELCKALKLPFDNSQGYLTMLANISAGDCGGWSGWLVKINGEFPQVGADEIDLQNGDTIEWIYSLDGGQDIGAW